MAPKKKSPAKKKATALKKKAPQKKVTTKRQASSSRAAAKIKKQAKPLDTAKAIPPKKSAGVGATAVLAQKAPASQRAPFRGVRVALLTGFGINSHRELSACFEKAGARAEEIHLNTLVARPQMLEDFHIFAIPGGFSFGDHLGSGRVLATRLRLELAEALPKFIAAGRPVLGICNGFQVLVKCGLLPALSGPFKQEVTLAHNESGVFENRWVNLAAGATPCVWLQGITRLALPVRHGEGKLVADPATLAALKAGRRDALRYVNGAGVPTQTFPENPNGSVDALAGLCDESGLVFGLMPHPEANMVRHHEPLWQTGPLSLEGKALSLLTKDDGAGMALFYNAVRSVKIS